MPRLDEVNIAMLGTEAVEHVALGDQLVWSAVRIPALLSPPFITGTPRVQQTVGVDPGEWDNRPTDFAYQWQLDGATVGSGASYTCTATGELVCTVTASNTAGGESASTAAVTVAGIPPVNVQPPEITGFPLTGQLLQVSNGTWSNGPVEYAYDWQLDGVSVGAPSLPSYTPTAAGEVTCRVLALNAHGSGIATSAPLAVTEGSPPGTFTTFVNPLPTMAIEPGGMVAHKINNTDPPHYGHCTTEHAIRGKTYIEVLLTFDGPYGNASVFHFYGGTRDPQEYSVSDSIGWWPGEPGAAIGMTGEWVAIAFANRGLPGEVAMNDAITFTRNPNPVTRRFQFCVDADARAIWFRTTDGPAGWVGGGDPVAGTSPSIVLAGTAPIHAGATSARIENVVEMANPDLYVGPVPEGYTRGIRAYDEGGGEESQQVETGALDPGGGMASVFPRYPAVVQVEVPADAQLSHVRLIPHAAANANGGNFRVLVYAHDPAANLPGELVAYSDVMQFMRDTEEYPISGSLPAGTYWVGTVAASSAFRAIAAVDAGRAYRDSGQWPSTLQPPPPAWAGGSGSVNTTLYIELHYLA